MNLISKMMTMVRGHATEAAQAVVDDQALTILDQEIRDAEKELGEARSHLADVMASHRGAERTKGALGEKIAELESYAVKAMDKGNETLAEQICAEIETKGRELAAQEEIVAQLEAGMGQIKRDVARAERGIAGLRNQASMVKATAKVQAASGVSAAHTASAESAGSSAAASLARIKARQEHKADRMEAARALEGGAEGGDLEAKMRAAGLTDEPGSTSAIMERLRARSAKGG